MMKQCFCYHSTNLLGNYSWMIAFEELTTSRTFFMTRTGLISIFGWQHYRLGTNTPSQRIAKNVVAHNHRCGKCYSMTSLGQQAPYQFTQELRKKNLMWMQGVQLPSSLPFPWLCQSVRVESKHIKVIKGPVNRPQPFFYTSQTSSLIHSEDRGNHILRISQRCTPCRRHIFKNNSAPISCTNSVLFSCEVTILPMGTFM